MDKYHSVHEEDISSFDLSSTHRLPTVSAAQVLQDLDDDIFSHISTGLTRLDEALTTPIALDKSAPKRPGGVQRGQVTEIWGPPGSGKTALGYVWHRNMTRGKVGELTLLAASSSSPTRFARVKGPCGSSTDNFTHFACRSLPHVVALLGRPATITRTADTVLVVIDSLSALINHAFPKVPDGRKTVVPGKGPSLAARRLQALQYIVSALQKLAATRGCAVVVLSQCATKMQTERSPTMIPSINAGVWEQGVSTRVVLFRDWIWKDGNPSTVTFAGVQKLDGKAGQDAMQSAAAFRVEAAGLIGVHYDTDQPSMLLSTTPRAKRKLAEAGLEVPDSEDDDDEEYGWEREDDAALPGMPPQWQGSEDLLLGTQAGSDDEEDGGGGGGGDVDDNDNDNEAGEGEEAEDRNG
ncbi:rad55 protein [Colletotrichum plurivorum]|uniref:Rad55 protein n=1 Tax=Colletotrichum plurivorum TaxID=2175906 RepID=A0A8H6NR05_9PEZI|nr:rad55 protein [Colletotrichum plurivorum]